MDPNDEGYLEALTDETELLQQRVDACRSHAQYLAFFQPPPVPLAPPPPPPPPPSTGSHESPKWKQSVQKSHDQPLNLTRPSDIRVISWHATRVGKYRILSCVQRLQKSKTHRHNNAVQCIHISSLLLMPPLISPSPSSSPSPISTLIPQPININLLKRDKMTPAYSNVIFICFFVRGRFQNAWKLKKRPANILRWQDYRKCEKSI